MTIVLIWGGRGEAWRSRSKVCDPRANTFAFTAQKTMYGGKQITEGDMVFVFAKKKQTSPQTRR
jgi:hypothetical protein